MSNDNESAELEEGLLNALHVMRLEMIAEGVLGWPNIIAQTLEVIDPRVKRYGDSDWALITDADCLLSVLEGDR